MNIVLIGYRGTGKSSVSRLLSTVLDMDLVEMDRLIAKKVQLSIPQIVEKFGWDRFRDLESEIARELLQRDNCVIDTGGGVILREENVENLKANSIVFWLRARKETIIERIKVGEERPSLTGRKSFLDEVEEVLKEREPLYQSASDWVIETDEKNVEEVTTEIVKILLQVDELNDYKEMFEEGLKKLEEIQQEV